MSDGMTFFFPQPDIRESSRTISWATWVSKNFIHPSRNSKLPIFHFYNPQCFNPFFPLWSVSRGVKKIKHQIFITVKSHFIVTLSVISCRCLLPYKEIFSSKKQIDAHKKIPECFFKRHEASFHCFMRVWGVFGCWKSATFAFACTILIVFLINVKATR